MRSLSFILLVLFSTEATAGTRIVGNGGDGLYIEGRLYSLDLVEAGVHKSPHFSTVPVREEFRRPITRKFKSVPNFPTELFLQKLSEIHQNSPFLAYLLAAAAVQLNWSAAQLQILPVNDEDSHLRYPKKDLRQLAVRRNLNVQIHQKHWDALDSANKVALIIHELLFIMMPVSEFPLTKTLKGGRQSSFQTRQLTGILFKADWEEQDLRDWLYREQLAGIKDRTSLNGLISSPENFEFRWNGLDRIGFAAKPWSRGTPPEAELTLAHEEYCATVGEDYECLKQSALGVRLRFALSQVR